MTRRRWGVVAIDLVVILIVGLVAVAFHAAGAQASTVAMPAVQVDPDAEISPDPDLGGTTPADSDREPGTGFALPNLLPSCTATAPTPSSPRENTAGLFLPDPMPVVDNSVFTSTGYGGYSSWVYISGCNPSDLMERFDYGATMRIPNALSATAVAFTSMTDSVHRQAWNPSWVALTLEGFADAVVDTLGERAWALYLALGLVITTAMLLWASRQGAISTAAGGAAWAALVVGIVGLVLAAPLSLALYGQALQGEVVSTIYGTDADPATAQTEQMLRTVHYTSWERRTFGNDAAPAALAQADEVWDSVTYTFNEMEQGQASGEAATALREEHSAQFVAAYEAVCDVDPTVACEAMQGRNNKSGIAMLELGFSLAGNSFRMASALLLVVSTMLLVLYGLVWLIASPYLVTPSGHDLRVTLLNNTWLAVTTALLAALGSWGFGIFTAFAMGPTIPVGWSLVLLFLGSFIFWAMLRPDRKLLSLATGGRVKGYGKLTKMIGNVATAFIGAKFGAAAGVAAAAKDDEAKPESEPKLEDGTYSYSYPKPPEPMAPHPSYSTPALGGAKPLEGTVMDREVPAGAVGGASTSVAEPQVVQGEVVPDPFVTGVDSSQTYRRGGDDPVEFPAPAPPTPGSTTKIEVYRRPDVDVTIATDTPADGDVARDAAGYPVV